MISGSKPVGRFAPSPTGELHFGSLVAAVGGYLYTKSSGGKWLLRIEDLDPLREVPKASDRILRALQAHGFEWDAEPIYQSRRNEAYVEALNHLARSGELFGCDCSRKQIGQQSKRLGLDAGVYAGRCQERGLGLKRATVRVRLPEGCFEFEDRLLGRCRFDWKREVGPFVVRRRDGLFAYQLAVVVDDAFSGVTQVVRGRDLLSSTPMQVHIQRLLGLEPPEYAHLPLVLNAQGQKLSKQTGAQPLRSDRASENLFGALSFLGHRPPDELLGASPAELLRWALENWRIEAIKGDKDATWGS